MAHNELIPTPDGRAVDIKKLDADHGLGLVIPPTLRLYDYYVPSSRCRRSITDGEMVAPRLCFTPMQTLT